MSAETKSCRTSCLRSKPTGPAVTNPSLGPTAREKIPYAVMPTHSRAAAARLLAAQGPRGRQQSFHGEMLHSTPHFGDVFAGTTGSSHRSQGTICCPFIACGRSPSAAAESGCCDERATRSDLWRWSTRRMVLVGSAFSISGSTVSAGHLTPYAEEVLDVYLAMPGGGLPECCAAVSRRWGYLSGRAAPCWTSWVLKSVARKCATNVASKRPAYATRRTRWPIEHSRRSGARGIWSKHPCSKPFTHLIKPTVVRHLGEAR
jgi:hypothetical protein